MSNLILTNPYGHTPTPEPKIIDPGFLARSIDSFIAAVSPKAALERREARIKLSYDAAQASRLRPTAQRIPFNPDSVHDNQEKLNVMFEARQAAENVGFIKGHLRKIQMYGAGSLTYIPMTGDKGMDSEITAAMNDFFVNCHVGYEYNLDQVIQMALMGMVRDGDSALTWYRDVDDIRLNIIEADQIGEWSMFQSPYDEKKANYVRGVWRGALGERQAYRIYDRIGEMQYCNPQQYEAKDVIFFIDSMKQQVRGVSSYETCLNNLKDKYQILEYEKAAVKEIGETGVVTYTQTGEAPAQQWAGEMDMTGQATGILNSKGQATFIRRTAAGTREYMGLGEKFEVVKQDRHSATFTGFLKTLDVENCHGLNLPYGFLVDQAEAHGAGIRIIAHVAGREFQRLQNSVLNRRLNAIRDVVLGNKMDKRQISRHPKFQQGMWLYPPPPTADIQRDSDIAIKELRFGLTNMARQYALYGLDYLAATRERDSQSRRSN